ncbi:hypothetical protein WIW50_12030 [Flavobacteriaceae bacterium 3-367]|uniref:hypothetical protein n=1 Tax=Eudoraea algarum TaxID=3417568 RepID=UPI003268F9D6
MSTSFIISALIASFLGLVYWKVNTKRDFKDVIEPLLNKKGFTYVSSKYPGVFRVGPFKKIEVTIGKPQINNGAVRYEKTFYRIVDLKTKNNKSRQTWAKIETSWFKETKVEFNPKLSEIKK